MSDSPHADDPFDFTPAPCSGRHDGWTPERQRAFILHLADHGGVAVAARAVGMTPQSVNRLRKRPGAEAFARAWDDALEAGRAESFGKAVQVAEEGRLVPVTRGGKVVGHRRVFNDRLLFAACYRRPAPRV